VESTALFQISQIVFGSGEFFGEQCGQFVGRF
jgi:hypothetical protein